MMSIFYISTNATGTIKFSLFLKMLRLGELRVCSGSSFHHGKQKARKMYSREKNLHVMFVDLKNNVMGMLTDHQQ